MYIQKRTENYSRFITAVAANQQPSFVSMAFLILEAEEAVTLKLRSQTAKEIKVIMVSQKHHCTTSR